MSQVCQGNHKVEDFSPVACTALVLCDMTAALIQRSAKNFSILSRWFLDVILTSHYIHWFDEKFIMIPFLSGRCLISSNKRLQGYKNHLDFFKTCQTRHQTWPTTEAFKVRHWYYLEFNGTPIGSEKKIRKRLHTTTFRWFCAPWINETNLTCRWYNP